VRRDEPHDTIATLGARVRALRLQRGLTLKALGSAAGLSHPFLSQLERGLARPSVGSVERIAHALGVSLGALWTPPRQAGTRVVRAGEGAAEGGMRALSGQRDGLRVREWSGDAEEEPEPALGEVVLYVARGSLELELEGKVHKLSEGDALFFDGSSPHRLRRTGGASTRALFVN
jgi:transcriptional regulator with XRE-family HTH domain